MELSELTAYAGEKFHMREQRKWTDFPGFSVLADPHTGKWVALLMRQWDFDTGMEIQRCDLKCGRQVLSERPEPYLSLPFRMRGKEWVGVIFDGSTEPDAIFRLFDRAVYAAEERGYTIVLDTPPTKPVVVYPETALPAAGTSFTAAIPDVPERIRGMLRLYEREDNSFSRKCGNFYRQGKFMEDYEDDAPWNGPYRRYFPTYHDLNLRQLRGYFTWRTHVRKGEFPPIAASLAYLYVYELLNGIGTSSPEDGLEKMRAFEAGFLDSGIGDGSMRGNLRRWMLEYAVLHGVSPELARRCADPAMLEKDTALMTLRTPGERADGEVFSALCVFGGKKLEQSPVVTKGGERGTRLFAAAWRSALEAGLPDGRDLFAACFGERKSFPWHPLSNAVYWERQTHPDCDYVLDACRTYRCRGGVWQEERYDRLYFDRDRFYGFLHETDRILRKYLKTGSYLREKPEESWASPYGEAAIRGEREAARPKVTIDLSHLERIRQDARFTRDSLLTEEELDAAGDPAPETQWEEAPAGPAAGNGSEGTEKLLPALDALHSRILLALLRGEPVEPYLKAGHLMPSVTADTINEALFDEIGDNVLECDGNAISLVEEYRGDILRMLGGNHQ